MKPKGYFYSSNLVLGALLFGLIVHELFHVLTISQVSSITLRFGSLNFIGVCCLKGTEQALENMAYLLQGLATIGWIIVGVKLE